MSDVLITVLEVVAVLSIAVGLGVVVAALVTGPLGLGCGILAGGLIVAAAAGWAGRVQSGGGDS
ncbi:MAG: hypothetical protein IPJ61_21735 [Tessaracoccus sp.]|uniref:hypothetical protein n=1 Tax=Tessaracoccus sp. TaxID=1971211 RepID=UPI001EBDAC5B|nr:hypothetical protein [Tessaracoccus sp.]MBK7823612.1 hypothetical protein [Tessaracoccus sp.]